MKKWPSLLVCFALGLLLCGRPAGAGELMVAAGAGYKRPLARVYQAFEQETGMRVEAVFGNMQQILSQTERSGQVAVAIGDQSFLARSTLFDGFTPLGKGRLVIIYNKYKIDRPEDLLGPKVVYVAMPDPKKAIYGRAAAQLLERTGLGEKIAGKMIVTATVPQVSSFVIAGAVEAGFVNITDAIAIRESIGGWSEVPAERYDPIVIGIAVVRGFADRPEVSAFMTFMKGTAARKILSDFGL